MGVVLALARLLGIAIQPVQQTGYRVPLMDPIEAALHGGSSVFWGNDDIHWVWLRLKKEPSFPLVSMRSMTARGGSAEGIPVAPPAGSTSSGPVFGLDFGA